MRVTFNGVRGSTPSACDATVRYGGNTSCVSVAAAGQPPIVLDMGTGLRRFGESLDGPFQGAMFATHLHWDHVQGLPFFGPALRPGAKALVYGPPQEEGSLRDVFMSFVKPPFFPITIEDLPCEVETREIDNETVMVGDVAVTARRVPHPGPTNGYRLEYEGRSVAYVPDHQQSPDMTVADSVLDLVDGVDYLIHDAQYTADEFALKSDWGHCTYAFAMKIAEEAGVGTLVLFHHDPGRDDDSLDDMLVDLAADAKQRGFDLVAAREGMSIDV